MFKPLPMQYVSIKMLTEDVPLVAQLLAEHSLFHPQAIEVLSEYLPERIDEDYYTLFHLAQTRFEKILARISFTPPPLGLSRPITLSDLKQLSEELGELWQQFSTLEEARHQLHEQQTSLKQLLETLQKFATLDIDLSFLQGKRLFLNLHIGSFPLANLQHVQEALTLAEHDMTIFNQDQQRGYSIIVGPLEHEEKVRAVLEHADFHALNVPPQFIGYPRQLHRDLSSQLKHFQQQSKEFLVQETKLIEQSQNFLTETYLTLSYASVYAQLTQIGRKRGQLALIEGWLPQEYLPKLESLLNTQLKNPFVLTSRHPIPSEYTQVPSLLPHHPLLTPYVTLIKNYGIPRYGEFDPTLWFTITFVLMFGSMFGDVGHGACIMWIGKHWKHQLKTFTPFFIAAGLSSCGFGFLYGSVFGFEHVLPALWMSPLQDPELMLTIALYWGMGFIFLATLITITNRWQKGEYLHAIFDNRGIMGLFLYLGGFYAIKQWMMTGHFETFQQLAILLPLTFILGYKWYENQMPFAERLLVTLIEGLESIINYLANTLSFLRVAAFSLNHVALAIAVFTLANMLGEGELAQGLVIFLGNLFIIILEGAIVTIQVLRLEYYEGFSRFFSGDGHVFRPLQIRLRK